MQKTLRRFISVDFRVNERILCLIAWAFFFISASNFLSVISRQMSLPTHTVHNGLYYTFEYDTLVDHVQTGAPFDFEKARGWRRGPAAYIWMWPIAKSIGKELSPKFIFILQGLLIFACIWISCRIYTVPGSEWTAWPLLASFWLGSQAVQYRVSLGDLNSLFSFALFPILSLWALSKKREAIGTVLLTIAGHFRILSIVELVYVFIRSMKNWVWSLVTVFIILSLGTLLVSLDQGYLYWWRMLTDLLGAGSDTRSAYTTWHENIALSGVVLKILSGFHFGGRYELFPTTSQLRVAKIITGVLQLFFIGSVVRGFVISKKLESPDPKGLLFNNFAFASFLTYIVAPEYGNDFLVTLLPMFLFGTYFFFAHRGKISFSWWAVYWFSVLLVLNLIKNESICQLFPFNSLNRRLGNTVGFICYESYNVFLIPVFGIFLNYLFLLRARKVLLTECKYNAQHPIGSH